MVQGWGFWDQHRVGHSPASIAIWTSLFIDGFCGCGLLCFRFQIRHDNNASPQGDNIGHDVNPSKTPPTHIRMEIKTKATVSVRATGAFRSGVRRWVPVTIGLLRVYLQRLVQLCIQDASGRERGMESVQRLKRCQRTLFLVGPFESLDVCWVNIPKTRSTD